MLSFKSISYEKMRLEYFRKQRDAAERRMNYWRGAKQADRVGWMEASDRASEAGAQYSFYKDVLEALENQSKWISVEERLPVEDETVIVCADDGCVYAAQYWGHGKWRRELIGCIRSDTDVTPTHWMPLPEPPKEET